MDLKPIADKYIKDNVKTLEVLLKKFEPIFGHIDTIKKLIVKLDHNNVTAAKDILTKLTGYYMEVVDMHIKLESLVKNKSAAYYFTRKAEIEAEGGKFQDGATKEEARLFVADERRVRDIFSGKATASIEGVRTCRALIPRNENSNKEVE